MYIILLYFYWETISTDNRIYLHKKSKKTEKLKIYKIVIKSAVNICVLPIYFFWKLL